MSFKFKYKGTDEAELDVTSFLNLMIVLVPVLLLTMTFTQIRVHEVKLPELTGGSGNSQESQSQLEVVIGENGFKVYYPTGVLRQTIPLKKEGEAEAEAYDYARLSLVMQEVKSQLTEKRDVLLLSNPNVDYQNLVSTMDAVKSFKTVEATSLVEIELFPEISLGDAS